MADWYQIDKHEARSNPLYGLGFWLWGLCSLLLFRFADANLDFVDEQVARGLTPEFYQLAEGDLLYLQLAVILRLVLFLFFLFELFIKPKWFRTGTIAAMLSVELLATGLAFFVDPLIGITKIASILITIVFCIYIARSKRVRLTFEHLTIDVPVLNNAEPNNTENASDTEIGFESTPLRSIASGDLVTDYRPSRANENDPTMAVGIVLFLILVGLIAAYQLGVLDV